MLVKYIVHGKVQGVFYRKTILQKVQEKLPNLKGHVKNLSSGDVEVLAEGTEVEINQLMSYCYEGSSSSHVEHIEFSTIEEDLELSKFHIAH